MRSSRLRFGSAVGAAPQHCLVVLPASEIVPRFEPVDGQLAMQTRALLVPNILRGNAGFRF
ncbi:hypothetical protein BKG82_28300 [Mycobacteroides chelonae]|uniref:Uncharacterized protein n=1 Tax=Mycobacteroides chelonae TaxID=1774 RepID=A0A1S1LKF3_MYCCH|nr:hypothetical protein BKG82_28300 [Mycobacteroides chelonae]